MTDSGLVRKNTLAEYAARLAEQPEKPEAKKFSLAKPKRKVPSRPFLKAKRKFGGAA